MANEHNTVLYTGITNDLIRRVWEHKEKMGGGFTKRYNVTKLVYYEVFEDPIEAITREKHLKAGPRSKKVNLVVGFNSDWRDLTGELSSG
jgi:putative endonuclease